MSRKIGKPNKKAKLVVPKWHREAKRENDSSIIFTAIM